MGVVGIVLMVVFVIVCVLMVAIVLVQDEEGGLGGLLGGSSSATFGSHSSSVLTKTTYVLVALFFIVSFALAFVNKAPKSRSLDNAIQQTIEAEGNADWFESTEAVAPGEFISAPEETSDSQQAE